MNNQQHRDNMDMRFREVVRTLPGPISDKFVKYWLACIAFTIIVVAMLLVSKAMVYLWGLIFPLYFAYLALSLVWDWVEGKIICQKMLCIKSQRKAGEQLYLVMKILDTGSQQEQILKFYVPVSKKDAELFTVDTILEVYYNPRHIGEMVAWEFIGNQ